jgi:SAM-dependent methyltransferase
MSPVGKFLGALRGRRGHRAKRRAELGYWKARAAAEGELGAGHYEWLFTTHQGLGAADYAGRRMLDVGCGPRGSLEWAGSAARRVGADPLAGDYRALGTDRHAMDYVEAGAERLPFPDASFDVVSCFNALDHVEDPAAALGELVRVLAPGGELLLIVEVGHAPTVHEPHTLGWDVLAAVTPPLQPVEARRYALTGASVHDILIHDRPLADGMELPAQGILSVRAERPAAT